MFRGSINIDAPGALEYVKAIEGSLSGTGYASVLPTYRDTPYHHRLFPPGFDLRAPHEIVKPRIRVRAWGEPADWFETTRVE